MSQENLFLFVNDYFKPVGSCQRGVSVPQGYITALGSEGACSSLQLWLPSDLVVLKRAGPLSDQILPGEGPPSDHTLPGEAASTLENNGGYQSHHFGSS